ncbi:hypothetical protein GQ43DRAFT_46309 [Delitschia confertaspora ATCC 74209]|uniref:Zn(2)-C6 fungal-type domain-containing protein n=1 Tax=Delitschia confertaspora ATCC 74209 TaxID=1513339 RepID=A0A9P4JL88_9PLEO|nr:hypothetical protein GQ43DRAFT_46309 [Delitschia confertaspora ATCC 74209]
MPSKTQKEPHVRKKAWKPKVKTGCITCRIRRVKCDEAKPHCQRCTSTGRKCDGYTQISQSRSPSQETQIVLLKPPHSPTFSPLQSDEEQLSFQFFLQHSTIEFSGLFESPFWQRHILQASHTYPAIRHAVIGIGAMHRKYIEGSRTVVPDDASDRQLHFALEQYNKAIREILQSSQPTSISDKVTMMVACILFNSLACLQGHQSMALEHLRNGLRLLKEVDREVGDDADHIHAVPLSTIRSMLVTMDVQGRLIMSDEALAAWEPHPEDGFTVKETPFYSFLDAQDYFETIFNNLQTVLQKIGRRAPTPSEIPALMEKYAVLIDQFNTGSRLLDEFLAQSTRHDERSEIAIKLVYQHVKFFLNISKYWDGSRELDWEADETYLERIVDLASQLLNAESTHSVPSVYSTDSLASMEFGSRIGLASPLARPVFVSGRGLNSALWTVSSRSKSIKLRRRAISMLLNYPRREGVWDGVLAGRIAWEALALEEAAVLAEIPSDQARNKVVTQIPDHLRFRGVNITYIGLRSARIEIRNTSQQRRGEKGVIRYVSW